MESSKIPLNGLVESFRGDAVKLRQIGIEDDLFVAEVMDERGELFRHEQGAGAVTCGCGFSLGGSFFGRHGEWSAE
jgi:hypothetical protein